MKTFRKKVDYIVNSDLLHKDEGIGLEADMLYRGEISVTTEPCCLGLERRKRKGKRWAIYRNGGWIVGYGISTGILIPGHWVDVEGVIHPKLSLKLSNFEDLSEEPPFWPYKPSKRALYAPSV